MEERLQKLLAQAGLCSRREAERWITDGRVTVNGRTASVGDKADLRRDKIMVDGRPLGGSEEKRYLMLYKPRGYVTTLKDERGRKTVADLVRGCGARVVPVGRLDYNSEGLLLLTNDGEDSAKIRMTIHEGRNRQIRRMCEKAGLEVRRLKRVAIGNMPLDPKLKSGAWRELTQDELAYLQDLCAGIEE